MKSNLLRLIYVFVALVCAVGSVLKTFGAQDLCGGQVWLVILFFVVLTVLIETAASKRRLLTVGMSFAVAGLLCLLFRKKIMKSCYSFLALIGMMALPDNGERVAPDLYFVMLLSIGVYLVTALVLRRQHMVVVLLLSIPLFTPVFYYRAPEIVFWLPALCAFAGLIVMTKRSAYTAISASAVLFCLSLLLLYIVPSEDYASYNIFTKIENRYHAWLQAQEPAEEGEAPSGSVGGINRGDMSNASMLTYTYLKMLSVTAGYEGTVYLRCFTGRDYELNRWSNPTQYEEPLFEMMRQGSFDIYNQQAELMNIIDNDETLMKVLDLNVQNYPQTVYKRRFRVDYYGADADLCYLPYGNTYDVAHKMLGDAYPINNTIGFINGFMYYYDGIQYDKIKSMVDRYSGSNAAMQQYVNLEKQYRQYVYNNYTDISQEARTAIANAKYPVPVFDGNEQNLDTDRMAYIERLSKYFNEHFTYTLSPGEIPPNQNLLAHFLDDTAKGYCIYYATAAALILRNAGIPARYVEGYAVKVNPENAIGYETVRNDRHSDVWSHSEDYMQYTVDVTDSAAHAWVEIYMDGYGWVPVDCTPGYITNSSLSVHTTTVAQDNDVNTDDLTEDEEDEILTEDEEENTVKTKEQIAAEYSSIGSYIFATTTYRVDFEIVWLILARKLKVFFRVALKVSAVLAVLYLLIWIPAKVSEIRRDRLFTIHKNQTPKQDAKQVVQIFAYVDKLCSFLGEHRKTGMSYQAFSRMMMDTNDIFEEANMDKVMIPALKVSFGRGNIGKAEMRDALQAVTEIREKTYARLGRIQKLLCRYVWHLK